MRHIKDTAFRQMCSRGRGVPIRHHPMQRRTPFIIRSYPTPPGAFASAEASTATSPNASVVSPAERDSAWDFEDAYEQNMNNARVLGAAFPEYRMWEDYGFFEKRQVGKASILSAHELTKLEYARAELYKEGCLVAGDLADCMARLRAVEGAFDGKSAEFRAVAQSLNIETTLLKIHEFTEQGLGNIFPRMMDLVAGTALQSSNARCLAHHGVPYAAGGVIPVLNESTDDLHAGVPGIIGKGDLGVFNGLTGDLVVSVETKLDPILDFWLRNKPARNLFLQGFAFMTGRDLPFLILATKGGLILIWRVEGVRRSEYRMWPNREYASFSNRENVSILHEIIGELARISSTSSIVAKFASLAETTTIAVNPPLVRANVPHDRAVTSTAEREAQSTGSGSQRQIEPYKRRWLVASRPRDFWLAAFDVATCLTPDSFEDLMAMKRPEHAFGSEDF